MVDKMSQMIKESVRRSTISSSKKYSRTKYVVVNDNDVIMFGEKTFNTRRQAMDYAHEHFRGGVGREYYVVTLKEAQRNEPGFVSDQDDYDD